MSHQPSQLRVTRAARCIRTGGIVAYPTEAVFGLGCDPANPQAVARLLALKRRPPGKGLILVAASRAQLDPWMAPLPPRLRQRLDASWPGPHTWLVPASDNCPDWLTGCHDTLAVRVSAHPGVQGLCRAAGMAIVSTSANRSGRPPARSLLEIRLAFGTGVDDCLPGALGGLEAPTRIQDLKTGRRLR
ncbi:MAG TPA: tRNA threonylcarbamoyladenosine biosynthesis protein RimN [Gammaproteobacteria bacterium]|nr:tRNA threonylcarbamoyladenosine biosynthesis protein RimN [Gammaproteobacteria bacterium]